MTEPDKRHAAFPAVPGKNRKRPIDPHDAVKAWDNMAGEEPYVVPWENDSDYNFPIVSIVINSFIVHSINGVVDTR
jgi:hypothetical protein